ncbi:hypothetical protein [Flavobacterium album]|uniref:hypothetical protein n=1 Tax=Flavobacterium album TaxID=2175091 RepID=UPI0011B21004|nr:hypothetical protein [Flavobacterium album]
MEHIFEFTYGILCLTSAAMMFVGFHYFMKRRITGSLAIKHHSELMMALCFFIAVAIALLVTISCSFILMY